MQLNAGAIQLNYKNGFLRTLITGGEEALRMIYLTFRDPDWNTARLTLTNENVQSATDSFAITYDWHIDDLGIQMQGNVRIDGQADGRITVTFYGKAVNTFWRNRVGFCVLHPIEGLAGQPCVIENPNGHISESLFPDLIAPHQPFFNIRAMTWQMASGNQFRLTFGGDVFETEDQRNWTDASYKTYCTPLERPFPVQVLAGTEIRQRIEFSPGTESEPTGTESTRKNPQPQPGKISVSATAPNAQPDSLRIGLGYCADGPPLTESEAATLRTLNLSHLRADTVLTNNDWKSRLLAARRDADRLNIPLELAVFFGPEALQEAQQLIDFVNSHAVPIYSLLLFETVTRRTTDVLLNAVVSAFRQQLPAISLGGGTDTNFVDLNRNRFDFRPVDFVTYSINPQVHLFDDQTLMENIAAQADTVRSAQMLSGGKPVHVSPVTLLPRFNPDAQSGIGQRTPPADPRQTTAFGAEWTRQSLTTLQRAGAASVAYYETHGPRGLLNELGKYPVFGAFETY